LGNREFRNGNTATKIISAVGKQCQHVGIQSKKRKTSVSKCFTNINHHSYNKQLVWNRYLGVTCIRKV
jgi:DNA-directed RNA polymerase subunit RPC12/RpoP